MARNAPADKPTPDQDTERRLDAAGHPDGLPAEIGPDGEPVIDAEIVSDSGATGNAVVRFRVPDREGGELVPRSHPAMVALDSWLERNLSGDTEADLAIAEIIAQVLTADSVEEVLGDVKAVGLKEMMDEPLTIHAVKYNRSDYEDGSPYYAVMDIERHKIGWRGPVTSGAQTILAQLARAAQLGELPMTCVCVWATRKATKKGHRPIKLAAVPPAF